MMCAGMHSHMCNRIVQDYISVFAALNAHLGACLFGVLIFACV